MKKFVSEFTIAVSLFVLVWLSIGIIRMPALDMKNTIQKGDVLVYRKFLLYPDHNDIVIYKSDYFQESDSSESSRYLFVQRIIGLPGDTILIDSNEVFINRKKEIFREDYQKNYFIQLVDSIEKFRYLDSIIQEKALISKKIEYSVSISQRLYKQLMKDTNVLGISYDYDNPAIFQEDIFPHNEKFKWSKHFWGPLYLPKKNDVIKLNKENVYLYYYIIQKEEKLASIQNDSLFIGNKYVSEYKFKENYYFVLGDNRDNAIDSRYLGPIKRKDIVGIVFWIIN
jgi:signal peptidase I